MAVVSCPHCQVHLKIDAKFGGQTLRCPNCRGAFVAPFFAPEGNEDSEEDNGFPLYAILACAVSANVVLWLLFAIIASPASALVWVAIAILIELTVWKRKKLLAVFQQVRQSDTTKRLLEQTASQVRRGTEAVHARLAQTTSSERDEVVTAMIADEVDDALVEIRSAKTARSSPGDVTYIGKPGRRRERPPMWGKIRGVPLNARLPTDTIHFYGPGTELDLGRGVVRSALTYATGAAQHRSFDASLIDGTLPVAADGTSVAEGLPYWPTYYDCSPAQRSHYLNWLLSGKSNPETELGYIFIYFYGLERRVLVDQADHFAIAQELVRLLPIYDSSSSFRRYASTLLWLTLYMASQSATVPRKLLTDAIQVTARWNDDLLGMCLAIFYNAQQPLPAPVAYLVSENDSRSSSSVIIRRHRDEFKKLFEAKYRECHGDGIQLRASKRHKRIDYHPASGTLLRSIGSVNSLPLPEMPDVIAISSQFKQIVQSWDESIDELRTFNRATRSSGGKLTAEAYEALPAQLQDGDHPEADAWMQAWEAHVDDEEWPIVPISALASIKGIPSRDRLTKAQCTRLLRTADAIGLGIEPDARMTGKNYGWNERVTLFFLDTEDSDDATDYIAASVLLRLGASIAEADGQVDKKELTFISEHLEGQFNLSDAESKRLTCLQYLLLRSRSGDNTISSTLAKRLSRQQRLLVGEFLVGVAASDNVITNDEVRALRKAYRSLDLDVADLDKLISRYTAPETDEASTTPRNTEVRLDMQAISRIMTETRKVAGILRDAMAEADEPGNSSYGSSDSAVATVDAPATGSSSDSTVEHPAIDTDLDSRFRPFLDAVLEREEWTPAELRDLADGCHVMMSGAVETINEWSTEQYGDWLIEEGDTYHVHRDLIEETI